MGFREMRVKAGLSVIKASRALDVSPTAVYQWEDGTYTPNAKRLPEIARLYGCTMDDLLREDGRKEAISDKTV